MSSNIAPSSNSLRFKASLRRLGLLSHLEIQPQEIDLVLEHLVREYGQEQLDLSDLSFAAGELIKLASRDDLASSSQHWQLLNLLALLTQPPLPGQKTVTLKALRQLQVKL